MGSTCSAVFFCEDGYMWTLSQGLFHILATFYIPPTCLQTSLVSHFGAVQ